MTHLLGSRGRTLAALEFHSLHPIPTPNVPGNSSPNRGEPRQDRLEQLRSYDTGSLSLHQRTSRPELWSARSRSDTNLLTPHRSRRPPSFGMTLRGNTDGEAYVLSDIQLITGKRCSTVATLTYEPKAVRGTIGRAVAATGDRTSGK